MDGLEGEELQVAIDTYAEVVGEDDAANEPEVGLTCLDVVVASQEEVRHTDENANANANATVYVLVVVAESHQLVVDGILEVVVAHEMYVRGDYVAHEVVVYDRVYYDCVHNVHYCCLYARHGEDVVASGVLMEA